MTIRTGNKKDIESIVALLKITLGEASTEKSVGFWKWKHIDNPFGESKVILAFDGEKLIGVRAFMKWEFSNDEQVISCVRAVDTAVHPDYQGKGIFSKLTQQALDECTTEGYSLVFNTPNKKSKKGYLKLGWIKNGRLPFRLSIPVHIPKKYDELGLTSIYQSFQLNKKDLNEEEFLYKAGNEKLIIYLSNNYIAWRYINCPVNQYGFLFESGNYLVVFRLKKIANYTELRFCEVFVSDDKASSKKAVKACKALINTVKPLMVSCGDMDNVPKMFYRKLGFIKPISIGPSVTLRKLKGDYISLFEGFKKWSPSLGTMELF